MPPSKADVLDGPKATAAAVKPKACEHLRSTSPSLLHLISKLLPLPGNPVQSFQVSVKQTTREQLLFAWREVGSHELFPLFQDGRFHMLDYILWISRRGIVKPGPRVPQEFGEGVVVVYTDALYRAWISNERRSPNRF